MNLRMILLAAFALLTNLEASAQEAYVIQEDRGGRIGIYVNKYNLLKSTGNAVEIKGLCASACTLVLGIVPAERICVGPQAQLGFHMAWDLGTNGQPVPNREASDMMLSMYPDQIRRWLRATGGLTPKMKFLRGRQLLAIYRPCGSPAPVLKNPPAQRIWVHHHKLENVRAKRGHSFI